MSPNFMINAVTTNRIKFILAAIVVCLLGYILQINFVISIFLIALFAYFKFAYRNLTHTPFNPLHLTLLFVVIFVSGYFIVRQGWSVFYIPFCSIPMLATLLFEDLWISFLLTIASAFTLASIAGNYFELGILFSISGLLSSLLIYSYSARRRITVIRAGFIIGVVQMFSLFVIDRFKIHDPYRYLTLMLNGVVSSIIVVGILPVFEYLFRTATNISLLELADFNHPLLQRMILEAPGTYHHSLIVGNLSEAASRVVGAQALLTRIGAYYHDIGKLYKPDYFSENQQISESKHDTLSPTMSKMVIMNHVKEGVELAKKHNLNPRLIDFIQQHHGSSLVYYFYRRALETIEEDQQIKEEGFRYPGPKPNTKETAIVLLADSVEAAARALRDPTPSKIEELVHKIINNKFIDGQLDECDLTLKDLEKISAVFIHILSGIYHNRITYPESSKSESNHKKPAKENPHQSEKDKRSSS